MNTKSSNINTTQSMNLNAKMRGSTQANGSLDSKLTQFNLFFEYDNSVSDVRKSIRDRAIR